MENFVITYITIISILGIFYGTKVKNLSDYIVGSKNHSTLIIIVTILGTIIGGPLLVTRSEFAYDMNINYILGSFGTIFSILSYYFIAPYLYKKYKNKISVGEIMQDSYGTGARLITGFCGFFLSVIFIGAQIKVFALLYNYVFSIKTTYGSIICVLFVSSYSLFGGARLLSVNMIFKFYTLLIIIPLFLGSVIQKFGGLLDFLDHSSIKSHNLDFSQINIAQFLSIFIVYALPYLSQPLISIILMGKDAKQSSSAFLISSLIFIPLLFIFIIIGRIAYVINPDIAPKISFFYVTKYINIEYRALLVIGIISVVTSTIDAYLNSGSISLVHDFIKPIYKGIDDKFELLLLKFSNLFILLISLVISISYDNIFLVTYSNLFWAPIITVPLLFIIFSTGNRTNFYVSLVFGFISTFFWIIFDLEAKILVNPIIIGTISSFFGYILANYCKPNNNLIL